MEILGHQTLHFGIKGLGMLLNTLKKKREKVKYESNKAEKQMVDAFFFQGCKVRKVFLLCISLESLNAPVLLLRKQFKQR